MSALSGALFAACLVLLGVVAVHGEGVRVEFQVSKLTNQNGITQKGKKCDVGSLCDHRIAAHVDTSSPKKGWPGIKKPEQWTKIFEKTDNDSPVINKISNEDLCTGSYQSAVLRLHIEDVDPGLTNDFVDDFECPCDGVRAAVSESQSRWSEEKTCTGKYNPANNKILYRCRAYSIPPTSCGRSSSRS